MTPEERARHRQTTWGAAVVVVLLVALPLLWFFVRIARGY